MSPRACDCPGVDVADGPPAHKLEPDDAAAAIRGASIHNVVQFVPDEPATNRGSNTPRPTRWCGSVLGF